MFFYACVCVYTHILQLKQLKQKKKIPLAVRNDTFDEPLFPHLFP